MLSKFFETEIQVKSDNPESKFACPTEIIWGVLYKCNAHSGQYYRITPDNTTVSSHVTVPRLNEVLQAPRGPTRDTGVAQELTPLNPQPYLGHVTLPRLNEVLQAPRGADHDAGVAQELTPLHAARGAPI